MATNCKVRHLIDSQDWSLGEIGRLWRVSRQLRDGSLLPGLEDCLKRKTVVLWFNKSSTRTRLTLHQAIVELGGTPLFAGEEDFHGLHIENIVDLARAMALSSSAICIRLLPTEEGLPYGEGESLLRQIAAAAEESNGVPVISLSHDRCHPCQGLYEMLTIQDALKRSDLKKTRILFTWVRGAEARPWSPTQDSLMLATRLGMNVTLCHPSEFALDTKVLDRCHRNALESGGSLTCSERFLDADHEHDVIYARHWATPEQQVNTQHHDWYFDRRRLGKALFLHPMPLTRGDEASAEVADGPQSLLRTLTVNKYYLQKAVLGLAVNALSSIDEE